MPKYIEDNEQRAVQGNYHSEIEAMTRSHTLQDGQIHILELLYTYRFASRQLLAESLRIKAGSSLHERLLVLMKHGYIGMRYERRLKLLGIPAAYYLLPKGLRSLQAVPGHEYVSDAAIKASYKDGTVGQEFITHTLNVYRYTNALQRLHPGLKVFTKRGMSRYDYFPPQLPDAFLSLPTDNPERPKRFFLDVIAQAMPRYAFDRRIAAYCTFFEDGGWDITGSDWPACLLIAADGREEKRIRRSAQAQVQRSDSELLVYTTTAAALKGETAIWTAVDEADELLALPNIS